jgi:quercetin dioxygenase-like cupin family protein
MRLAVCGSLVMLLIIALVSGPLHAEDKMVYAAKASSKFVNFPGLPKCMTGSVQNGDPSKSPSVILAKAATGCVIPWHWHSANEQVMMISGGARVAMKDGTPSALHSGDYISLPSKNAHQFTCTAVCSLFIVSDAAFDIHYVDKDGKEISPDEALKSKAKSVMHKEMKEKKE